MTETAAKLHSLLLCDPANTDSMLAYTIRLHCFLRRPTCFYTGFALKTN